MLVFTCYGFLDCFLAIPYTHNCVYSYPPLLRDYEGNIVKQLTFTWEYSSTAVLFIINHAKLFSTSALSSPCSMFANCKNSHQDRREMPKNEVTHRQECSRPMFFSPEQQRSIQRHRERQVGRPELGKSNPVVPNLAFGDKSHAKDTVRQQELDPFRHVGVKALGVGRVVHIFAAPLKSRYREGI